jgi:hypothetical protein
MTEIFLSNQNDPENIKLLRASTFEYTSAKNGEIKIAYFLLFLAWAYPIFSPFSIHSFHYSHLWTF